MGAHIAIVGNGRIGRPTAYTLLCEKLAEKISLVDTKPGLSWAFSEELRHVAASTAQHVKIEAYEDNKDVSDADLLVVCPGKPRVPGVEMDRRDLVAENARIICYIAEVMPPMNPDARWVIVTNPVDAMATLFKTVSGEDYVISTGDVPDTLRFRSRLALDLGVPVHSVEGFVGGEHGSAAYPLWSTVKVGGVPLGEYLEGTGKTVDRVAVTGYVRGVSKRIVDIIGGTEVGPAAGFRDIVKAILGDTGEVLSVADSLELPGVPGAVNVSVPTRVGLRLGPNLWGELAGEERASIVEAAKAIYGNYRMGLEAVGRA